MGSYFDESEAGAELKLFIHDLYTQKHLTISDIARLTMRPTARIYKELNVGNPYAHTPLYSLPVWTSTIGPELAQHVMSDAHYGVVELPRIIPEFSDASRIAGTLMEDCGDLLTRFAKAMADGHVSIREYRELEQTVQNAISAMLAVKLAALGMVQIIPRDPRGHHDD